jgi:hypothetical protein
MTCAYCQQNMNAILSGKFCYRRRSFNGGTKLHSPWIIEPLEPIEREW